MIVPMRAVLGLVALFGLWCVAGCTAGPAPRPPAPAPSSPDSSIATASDNAPSGALSLSCDSPIDTATVLTSPVSGILDVVGLDATSTLPVNDAGGSAPHQLFAKTGLYVHAGHKATLSLPPEWASRVSITWGNAATQWTTSLQIPACPVDQGQWQVFPGGFSLDTPACVPLQVRAQDQTATVDLSLGAPCPK